MFLLKIHDSLLTSVQSRSLTPYRRGTQTRSSSRGRSLRNSSVLMQNSLFLLPNSLFQTQSSLFSIQIHHFVLTEAAAIDAAAGICVVAVFFRETRDLSLSRFDGASCAADFTLNGRLFQQKSLQNTPIFG